MILAACGDVSSGPPDAPEAQPATLVVSASGDGTGTVTSSPAGIDCGADCEEVYAGGTVVTLTATPMVGSSFAGWSGGGCSGTGPLPRDVELNVVARRFGVDLDVDHEVPHLIDAAAQRLGDPRHEPAVLPIGERTVTTATLVVADQVFERAANR